MRARLTGHPMRARLTGRPDEGQRPEEAKPQAELIYIQAR
jgi:hypothetical protein